MYFWSNGNSNTHCNICLLLDFCTCWLPYMFSRTNCVGKVGTACTKHTGWCQSVSVSMILSLEMHNYIWFSASQWLKNKVYIILVHSMIGPTHASFIASAIYQVSHANLSHFLATTKASCTCACHWGCWDIAWIKLLSSHKYYGFVHSWLLKFSSRRWVVNFTPGHFYP
jgi:hypothetical protein